MKAKRHLSLGAVLVALGMIAAACTSSSTSGTTTGEQVRKGGNLIIAAEQFPDCLNVIDTCSNASWMHWAAAQFVVPKAMALDPEGNFVATPLLKEAPTLSNGGLKENPFTITYNLNENAKWDDGTDITFEDFEFTRQAVLQTKGSLSTLGYNLIKSITAGSSPKQVVIEFTEVYADWPDLFGGVSTNGYVLPKHKFPDGPDLAGKMQDMIDFSGGPWKMTKFTKDQEMIFVPNTAYWGSKPNADQVTVVAREDQSTELQSLFTGEVFAIYPQPSGGNIAEDLKKPNVKAQFGAGTTYEGLWINHDSEPMNDKLVRQAFAYATDRQSIVDTIVKPNNPEAAVLNCAGWVPNIGDWCDSSDFQKYAYNPTTAKELLKQAGWTCPETGTCTKGGKNLTVNIHTTAGNQGRADTLAIVQDKAKAAGFDVQIKTLASPSPIFTDFLPKRQHTVALFANVASPDPTVTVFLSCNQIPKADGSGGQNWSGWCNQEATTATEQADRQLDTGKRRELLRKVGDLEAEEIPWLPLYQKPLITAWREDKIGGPVGAYTSSPLSAFYNIHEWFVKA